MFGLLRGYLLITICHRSRTSRHRHKTTRDFSSDLPQAQESGSGCALSVNIDNDDYNMAAPIRNIQKVLATLQKTVDQLVRRESGVGIVSASQGAAPGAVHHGHMLEMVLLEQSSRVLDIGSRTGWVHVHTVWHVP